ncbi:hypothetical protein A464_plas0108 (plasmid) [Salmonella bongori N268-08]|uniref:Uncharacterized protein n=1 Tax=Salmonella bongori N268-08 TaxID=1197719 RepID=S5NNY3_SALBN|nr:hypothetical protein A464_plas0108 [Salmonella bongori N268-08]
MQTVKVWHCLLQERASITSLQNSGECCLRIFFMVDAGFVM